MLQFFLLSLIHIFSMGMVDGIVMELQGFWIIGLVRVIVEAVKNLVLNAQLEQRLRNS